MSVTGGQGAGPSAGSRSRRRPREEAARSRAVLVRLTEEEFGELTEAAGRARMARAAYAAEAALSAARGTAAAPDEDGSISITVPPARCDTGIAIAPG